MDVATSIDSTFSLQEIGEAFGTTFLSDNFLKMETDTSAPPQQGYDLLCQSKFVTKDPEIKFLTALSGLYQVPSEFNPNWSQKYISK